MEKFRSVAKCGILIIFTLLFACSVCARNMENHQVLDVQAALMAGTQRDAEREEAVEEKEEVEGEERSSSSVVLTVMHRDWMASGNRTVKEALKERLERDAKRVESINARVEMATMGLNASAMKPISLNSSQFFSSEIVGQKGFSSSIISGLSQGSGEYFTRLGVGTPARYTYMVLDTGSDIIWLQCLPCTRCYQQTDRLFNPSTSSSYRKVMCGAPLCRRLDISGCRSNRYCQYQVSYGDGSFTVGDYSRETLTFRGSLLPNVALGCGHDNEGLFVGAAGLLGLGRGPLSLPSQAARRFGNKFSYCLVDREAQGTASSLIFGPAAAPRGAVFTPMVRNPKLDTFYYVELVGISVGGVRLTSIPASLFRLDESGNGGVIIDSGTSVTRLVQSAYVTMRDAFRAGTRKLKSAGEFSLFDTCYDLSGLSTVKVPTVVFHFQNGADVSLPANNYLIPVDSSGIFCFAFAGNTGGLSIIGNIQQQGFRVVFDGQTNRVGFAAGSCAS
uniref:Peptidase A1 domain-containing protein n=1 Tax=Araucaria cunninghamii TaxID=56994 RepID=A0A0D6R379_ARACU